MLPSEVEKIFRVFAEERKRALPQFTPDGIPITMENKFDDAIYNYLYAYWKEQSGEYDPKKDVIPESEMNKMHPKTKNEKKFEQWLLQQYGMTNKEQREYTFKGNLLSLGEIALSAWGIEGAGATKLVVPGKFLASNADDTAKKALQQDTIEDTVEGTLKKEVAEEVAENTTKKEMADTAEDLSQKTIDKNDILKDNNGIKENIGKIHVEGNKNIFTNSSGKEIIWTDQTSKDIDTIIKRKLNSSELGDLLEGKVAQAVNEVTEVKGVGLKLSDISKSPVGDLDIVTDDYIIEVKSSLGAVKEKQIPKYTDPSNPNYVNSHNRKVIYFIEDAIPKVPKEIQKLEKIKSSNIIIVDNIDDLKEILKNGK